jgi:mRNA interferase RelE/StbE
MASQLRRQACWQFNFPTTSSSASRLSPSQPDAVRNPTCRRRSSNTSVISRTSTWPSSDLPISGLDAPERSPWPRWNVTSAWRIEFAEEARRELLRPPIARRIHDFLTQRLAPLDNPRSIGEALKGPKLGAYWKYWIGDWRIIAVIEDGAVRILVVRIGNRREVYRQGRYRSPSCHLAGPHQGLPGTILLLQSAQCPSACTISSVIFFASPNSIIVFGRKNSSLSTPA